MKCKQMMERKRRRIGAAATELALLLPFLALMLGATLDFSRVYYATQILQQSAAVGALYASGTVQTSSTIGSAQAATNAACACGTSLQPSLGPQNITVNMNNATTTVIVDYEFMLLTPVLGPLGQIHLRRSVTMNVAPSPGQ